MQNLHFGTRERAPILSALPSRLGDAFCLPRIAVRSKISQKPPSKAHDCAVCAVMTRLLARSGFIREECHMCTPVPLLCSCIMLGTVSMRYWHQRPCYSAYHVPVFEPRTALTLLTQSWLKRERVNQSEVSSPSSFCVKWTKYVVL